MIQPIPFRKYQLQVKYLFQVGKLEKPLWLQSWQTQTPGLKNNFLWERVYRELKLMRINSFFTTEICRQFGGDITISQKELERKERKGKQVSEKRTFDPVSLGRAEQNGLARILGK